MEFYDAIRASPRVNWTVVAGPRAGVMAAGAVLTTAAAAAAAAGKEVDTTLIVVVTGSTVTAVFIALGGVWYLRKDPTIIQYVQQGLGRVWASCQEGGRRIRNYARARFGIGQPNAQVLPQGVIRKPEEQELVEVHTAVHVRRDSWDKQQLVVGRCPNQPLLTSTPVSASNQGTMAGASNQRQSGYKPRVDQPAKHQLDRSGSRAERSGSHSNQLTMAGSSNQWQSGYKPREEEPGKQQLDRSGSRAERSGSHRNQGTMAGASNQWQSGYKPRVDQPGKQQLDISGSRAERSGSHSNQLTMAGASNQWQSGYKPMEDEEMEDRTDTLTNATMRVSTREMRDLDPGNIIQGNRSSRRRRTDSDGSSYMAAGKRFKQ